MNILDYISHWADEQPDKEAIIWDGNAITYAELLQRMKVCEPLPIPLLGERWDGDFCLYTTGTTGKSKGVMISQQAVIANSENLIAGQGYHRDLVFIVAGDMTHLGCWSKIFPTLMQGGTLLVLKDGMKDPNAFFDALSAHCSPLTSHLSPLSSKLSPLSSRTRYATFLVPSNIRILLQFSADRLAQYADRIDFIETGAAPISQSDMKELCSLLPHSRLYNTYASTETGVISTYNFNANDNLNDTSTNSATDKGKQSCIAGCLGKALPHSAFFITPEGKIACQGDTLMTAYRDAPELTSQILKDDVLYTNDNGFIDSQGRLHILGRDDDTINVGGYKIAPSEIEEAALSMPDIEDCICIAQPHKILGNALALLVVLRPGTELNKRAIALYLNARLDRYKVPMIYRQVDTIHRTFNGKLDRKAYQCTSI